MPVKKKIEKKVSGKASELVTQIYERTITNELQEAISALKESEQSSRLLMEIASAANAASTMEGLFQVALDKICEFTNWPIAHVFIPAADDKEAVVSSRIWHFDDDGKRYAAFKKVTEESSFKPGEGLPGRVYSTRAPIWIIDVSEDPNFTRSNLAQDIGVKGVFSFPVIESDKVAAIIEVFSPKTEQEDGKLLDFTSKIALQLGIVIQRKKVEEKLEQLSRAVEHSPATVIITDPGGFIEYVNPKFSQITGYTLAEVKGKNPRILKSGRHSSDFYKNMWKTITSGKEWHGELRNLKKNGELYWETASISPVMDNDGDITHFVAVKEDITEHKIMENALEESERKFREIFDQSAQIAVLLTTRGNVLEVSKAVLQISGLKKIDLVWRPLWEISGLALPEAERFKKAVDEAANGRLDQFQFPFTDYEGKLLQLIGSFTPIRDEIGEVEFIYVTANDITERIRAEKEMERSRELAEAASKTKSEFLANMSHEIRTPMNAIIGLTHLLQQTELTGKQEDYLKKIVMSSTSLLAIINDILDLSKIESGKMQMEAIEFNLDEVLENLNTVMSTKAENKEIDVIFKKDESIPNPLIGDPLRLSQVLMNIGSNAIKFTEKGEIIVKAESLREEDNELWLKFSVKDSGIGISNDQRHKLFQDFSQADSSTTRKYGGTGLGLSISKKLVEMLGGEIWFESTPGEGSEFIFTARFEAPKIKKNKFVCSSDIEGLKVLVVDDNKFARFTMNDVLRSFKFDVELAASAGEAIDKLIDAPEDKPFKLVLMDWHMPGMSGIEAAKAIKKHDKISHIPKIIMVTAYAREEVMRQADRANLDGYLIKPVERSLLYNTIAEKFGFVPESKKASEVEKGTNDIYTEALRGANILLAEDNEINQEITRKILEAKGINVTTVSNGKEAVEEIQKTDYDLVLMDNQMPVMDGTEATGIIRRNPCFKDLPIIAMTASSLDNDKDKFLRAGMNAHVTKLTDIDHLFRVLIQWIRPHKLSIIEPLPVVSIEKDEAAAKELSFINGIDFSVGLKRLNGNSGLFKKLLLKFRDDNSETIAKIRKALSLKEDEDLTKYLHTLKGVAGNLGIKELYISADELEAAVRNKKEEKRRDLEENFLDTLNRVNFSIDNLFLSRADKAEGKEKALCPEEIFPVLLQLKEYIMNYDTEAIRVFEGLKEKMLACKGEKKIIELERLLGKYDFERALEKYDEIAQEIGIEVKGGSIDG